MHHCLFSLTSPANAHTIHCPDPWSVPEKLFLPLAQTTAQLSCHLICPPSCFPFVIEQSVCSGKLHVVFHTLYGASMALCECDKEWPLVSNSNFARWVAGSDNHGPLSTCRKQMRWHHPWTWGDWPPPRQSSDSAGFHPGIYNAIPPCQPATGKHTQRFNWRTSLLYPGLLCGNLVEQDFGWELKGWG